VSPHVKTSRWGNRYVSLQTHVSISVNYRPIMFINNPSFYCIKTSITTDQLTNHGTWCVFHSYISLQYTDYTDRPSFVYWTFVCLSRINTLTLNDLVERVSNYNGLDDCSVFTG